MSDDQSPIVQFKRGQTLTTKELANFFGYSAKQIQDWINDGAPLVERATKGGQSHKVNSCDFHHWLIQRERARTRVAADKDDPRNRERNAKAELAEIDLMLKRGELYRLSDFTQLADYTFVELKSELMRTFRNQWKGSRHDGERLIVDLCNQYRDRLKGELKVLEPAT